MTRNPDGSINGVEFATRRDENDIFALLMTMHGEMGFFRVNPDKVTKGIQHATNREGGFIWVIKDKDHVVATLGMVFALDWYSDDEYLSERWNYVHPQYRRSTDYARRLIEQAKWTADQFRLPLCIGINSLDRTEAKIRLYARHFPCVGAYFLHGDIPMMREREKLRAEQHAVTERTLESRRRNVKVVRPVVETIIRVSQRA
jgi:hypothetical protein